jgi:hypothetical protein
MSTTQIEAVDPALADRTEQHLDRLWALVEIGNEAEATVIGAMANIAAELAAWLAPGAKAYST